ncbi:MAG: hypothetical protein K9I85_08125 [Saprospiraceae bacterium]|nr:hypothetical protein [Saprospiraceae bacterium]
MRTSLYLLFFLLVSSVLTAQAPQQFNFQGVARDGGTIVSGSISLQLSLHQGTANGPVVFRERHTTTTNTAGVFNVLVGQGTPLIGTIAGVDWSTGPYFLHSELDPTGGLSFTDMGTTPLSSVPYALLAGEAINDAVDDADADPTNEIQSLAYDDPTKTLSISGGNSLVLPGDADADPTNEIQILTQTGGTLTLSKGGGNVNINDADPDPMNELQTLSKSGNVISLSSGGSVTDEVDDADADPNNELQVLSKSANIISLSSGGSVTDEVDDADANPANELQSLSWNPSTTMLSISQGNAVDLTSLSGGSSYWKDHTIGIYYADKDVYVGHPDSSAALHLNPYALDFHTGAPHYSVLTPSILQFEGTGVHSYMNKGSVSIEGPIIDQSIAMIHDSTGFSASASGFANGFTKQSPYSFLAQPFGGNTITSKSEQTWDKFGIVDDLKYTDLTISNLTFGEDGLGAYAIFGGEGGGFFNLYNGGNWSAVEANTKDGYGWIETKDQTGGRNVLISTLIGFPKHGYVAVSDGAGDPQAGMYVDGLGNGYIFADGANGGVKAFVMPHPTKPEKEIWYASLEGPEAGAYERGVATLTNGEAWVPFSESFEIVANPETMTVILTSHSADTYGLAVVEKTATGFKVKEFKGGEGNFSFDWEAKCVRKGWEHWQVERDKRERAPGTANLD